MSEKDIFDEKLAKKFRETFEDFEVAYNPADWEQLRPALPPSPLMSVWRNHFKKNWVAVAASLTALMVVAYFFMKPPQEKPQLSQTIDKEIITKEEISPLEQNEQKGKAIEQGKEQEKMQEKVQEKAQETLAQNTTIDDKTSNKQIAESEKLIADTQVARTNDKNNNAKVNPIANEETVQNNILITQNKNVVLGETAVEETTAKKQTLLGKEAKITFELLPIHQQDSVGFLYELALPTPQLALVILAKEQEAEIKKPKRNVAFGFAVNPILFRNELDNHFTMETGLQVSVPVASRLRLTTGLFVANQKMNYSKTSNLAKELAFDSKDMNTANVVGVSSAPRENWVQVVASMRNNFTMLNIPIHLQYDFMYGEKMRFFASIGVTNYTYLTERYEYENNVTPYYISTQSRFPTTGNIGNNFASPMSYDVNYERAYDAFSSIDLGSSIHLSSGVEFPISSHFSLQASPFVRVPVRRIGHHGLAFDTFGLAVIMNYR